MGLVAIVRGPAPRVTNLSLLVVLLLVFGTGIGVVAVGTPSGRWLALAHGVAGMAIVLLVPWKSRVVRRGLRRARQTRWLSLLLAALTAATVLTGIGYATGLVRTIGGLLGMWLHVAAAAVLLPLAAWHVLARRARPHTTDLSRRTLIKAGLFTATAAGFYTAQATVVNLTGAPGAERRFTGSYQTGSFNPAAMPSYTWLSDTTPTVDPDHWRLTISGRELTLHDLSGYPHTRVRATLDCTSGWYAEQDWAGVPLRTLLPDTRGARSLTVHSVTGYSLRFPVRDIDNLLLATTVGGTPLSPGHGYPARLVAPGRRGFWWVKWVDRIDLTTTPWWWQPPFPLT